ncbi:c-type cytochrome [Rubripirellula sp.]|nr:c-type cytochrome [Rubripirellula sp.]MDB4644700.1 c-type cytochrome [Rubripirellula sp.]
MNQHDLLEHERYQPFHSPLYDSPCKKFLALLLCLLCTLSGTFTIADAERPKQQKTCWIWAQAKQEKQAIHDEILFKKEFQVPHDQTTASLKFSPCFSHLRIKIDGILIGSASPYQGMKEAQLQHHLSAGSHSLTVEAVGVDGPSAFFTELTLTNRAHPNKIIHSDSDWLPTRTSTSHQQPQSQVEIVNLGPIEAAFSHPQQRRVGIDALDNYEQWKLALRQESDDQQDTGTFAIAGDFQIQQVPFSTKPLMDLGSWVSMTIDSDGRLIIAREANGLLRLTLSPEGDSIESTEWINRDLKECRGLTFRGEELFANANNSKGLYRLRPMGDGFGEPELIYASSGGVGHGRNDLVVGPDQLLYAIHGDAVDLPKNAVDHTSPYRQAAKGTKTSEGHLLRINPDNGKVEILAAGLRNPYGIDFNTQGDCFTYDADAEYDMGAPWYRPTRMLHLTTGGDFGWRGVTRSWPAYYPDHPDNAVPGLDIGKGSPTTVKFGTRSNFPPKYRQGLFVLDWAYGRILLVNLLPRGSSYTMTSETFLKGRPLNVTDLDFGPDGSMYLITGGRKTQSTLYRVKYIGKRLGPAEANTETVTAHHVKCQNFASTSRQARHDLESLLTNEITDQQFGTAWQQLGNPDPWIRHAAARVVERVPTSQWEEKALGETDPNVAVQAITCLMRSQESKNSAQAIMRLAELARKSNSQTKPSDPNYSIRPHALYGIKLALAQLGKRSKKFDQKLIASLSAMYPAATTNTSTNDTASSVESMHILHEQNRLLSELLATLGDKWVVSKTIQLLKQTTSAEQRLHYLYVLRNVVTGWTPDLRRTYFTNLAMAAEEVGGAGLPDFLQRIKEDAMKQVSAEDQPTLAAIVDEWRASEEPTASLTAVPRPIVQVWTVEQILSGTHPTGNKKDGKKTFATAGCIHCHRFATDGQVLGPDLTAAMSRYSRRDLLAAVVKPSDVIAENYRSVQILTKDGRVVTGQITRGGDYRSPVLRIATDPNHPSHTVEIQKSDIASRKSSQISWMPEGLLNTLTRQQIFDLIAYLESSS